MQPRRLCPTCQAEFTSGEQFCAYDATPLVDATEREEPAGGSEASRRLRDTQARWAKDPLLGTVIAERYAIQQVLGEGGMGMVYRAQHKVLDRTFAIKVLRREMTLDAMARGRFEREARAASLVCHSHIVTMYDYGYTAQGLAYLVMEYLDGITLADYARETPGHTLPMSLTVEVALQVAQALQHAHERGVVHRDIKPTNVLLTTYDGESDYVKVLDFGIARILDQAALTMVQDGPPGTVPYMAPEMFSRPDYLSPAVDLYALGILIYHLMVGQPPFLGEDMDIVMAHIHKPVPWLSAAIPAGRVPVALDQLLAQLLAKEPTERPSAAQAVERLMQIRPQLPPRSLRSLLALQTMVLNESQQGQALHGAQTYVLPYNRPGGTRSAVLQPTLHELDQLESGLQRVSAQLGKHALALLRRRWPRGSLPSAPPQLVELAQQVAKAESEEEEHGMQLALLREDVRAEQLQADARHEQLHGRLVAQRAVMRERPGQTAAARKLQAEALEALERACMTAVPHSAAAARLPAAQQQLQELQQTVHALRRQLAGQTLRAYLTDLGARGAGDAIQDAVYTQLETSLAQFDEQSAAVTLISDRLP